MITVAALITSLSCTSNLDDELFLDPVSTQNAKPTILQSQISALGKRMNSNKTIQGAKSNGYLSAYSGSLAPVLSYYLNEDLVDDTFEINNPEIILFSKNSKGIDVFIGVAYLIPSQLLKNEDFVLPSGFHGSDDLWRNDKLNKMMILYVWLGVHNERGVFSTTLPNWDADINPGKDDFVYSEE